MSDTPSAIVLGQAPKPHGDRCGCCSCAGAGGGLHATENRPGLAAIRYRAGTHASFTAAMKAGLSAAPAGSALRQLHARETTDFSIALIDSWAVVSDVITLYQERIANESYLRTATERLSVVELARLIGYRARPGLAASTYLAFAMDDAAGAPEMAVQETAIATGVRVQSVPGPGQEAQTFETVETVRARVEWSAMRPLLRRRMTPHMHDQTLYLAGTGTQLKQGDALLLVGFEQEANPNAEFWDLRFVAAVEIDHDSAQTRVTLDDGLGSVTPYSKPTAEPRVYAMRLRASLYGYNGPEAGTLRDPTTGNPAATFNYVLSDPIDLDAYYPQIVPGSWLALSKPSYRELYTVKSAVAGARTDFWVTAKTTKIAFVSDENLAGFGGDSATYRATVAYAQSDELPLGEEPVAEPVVRGDTIVLDRLVAELDPGRTLIVRGKRPRVKPRHKTPPMFRPDGGAARRMRHDEVFVVLAVPMESPWTSASGIWSLRDENGKTGAATATHNEFSFVPAVKDDEVLIEVAEFKSSETDSGRYTVLHLAARLSNVFDLYSTEVLGNVALATHGETTGEILGHGDASARFQRFTLKQTPLTYVGADNASGVASTLEVRVGNVLWHEVPSFYGAGPKDRIYTTEMADDGKVTVMFGDGKTGALPPSGQNNLRATYRKGIGPGGLLDPGQLSLLLTRPPGVTSAVNPFPSTGAAGPEPIDAARRNAPVGVLTLDRIVSLRDYTDFARSFAGIAKAQAEWIWSGSDRRVLLTIAGEAGATVDAASPLYRRLKETIRAAGDPYVAVDIVSFRPVNIRVGLRVKINSDFMQTAVLAAVEGALRNSLSFDARDLRQPVSESAIIATAQGVDGVIAVDLDSLYRAVWPFDDPIVHPRLTAAAADGAALLGAELLILDPAPLVRLEAMP